jgi:hypothetical protein
MMGEPAGPTICGCLPCKLRAAITLLETGCPNMVLTVLKGWQEEMMATIPNAPALPNECLRQGHEAAQRGALWSMLGDEGQAAAWSSVA